MLHFYVWSLSVTAQQSFPASPSNASAVRELCCSHIVDLLEQREHVNTNINNSVADVVEQLISYFYYLAQRLLTQVQV
jgi:hypothetical protein